LDLAYNVQLDGMGIRHPYSLINQEGALLNLAGANVLGGSLVNGFSGTVGFSPNIGVGVQQIDSTIPSELSLTARMIDYDPAAFTNPAIIPSFNRYSLGSAVPDTYTFDVGTTAGVLNIDYDMDTTPIKAKDQLQVIYQGKVIADTKSVLG